MRLLARIYPALMRVWPQSASAMRKIVHNGRAACTSVYEGCGLRPDAYQGRKNVLNNAFYRSPLHPGQDTQSPCFVTSRS